MPSPALGDPRRARDANRELEAPFGRCACCYAPLPRPPFRGRARKWCGDGCKLFAWRRDGDPDGRLNWTRAGKR